MILTNELPRFADASGALASRFVVSILTRSFYGKEDPALTAKLLEEAAGIFNWALQGLDRLHERGYFETPPSSREAQRHLEDLSSPVSAFVRDQCRVDPKLVVDKDDLWAAWKQWCADEGMPHSTKSLLVRNLRASVPGVLPRRVQRDEKRVHVIAGIGLGPTIDRTPDTPDAEENEADRLQSGVPADLAQPSVASGMSGVQPIAGPSGVAM
jgi:putative DNA primase/helicase